jgi:hypothetical protein
MNNSVLRLSAGYLIMASLLAGCQIGGSTVTEREGYFSWVDEQGRVRYSAINEPVAPGKAQPEPGNSTAQTLSKNEKAPEQPGNDTEYTLENYPDADQLAKDGYIRPGQRQPYFTWRDAQGNLRVSYYRPDTRTDMEKGFVEPPIELTPASVYRAGADLAPVTPVAGSDPDAFAVLGVEAEPDSYLERFSEFCCEDLETDSHQEWVTGREFGIDITDDSPVHTFLTGESPFQLIALSSVITHPDFIMQVHSYAREGVLVPSLAFLDRDFKPVRVVTDLASNYVPENWHRRGYLQAWVPVFPEQGERWLVVYTRPADLQGQEVIETDKGPKAIPHVATGELGFSMAEQN